MINLIKIGTNSRTPIVERKKIGIVAENDIEKLQFILDKELITENTIPQLEVEFPDLEKKNILLNRVNDTTAEIEIKNSLLKQEGNLKMQFVLNAEDNVVFKSDIFTMYVKEAINAEKTIEEEYPTILQEVQEIKEGLNSKVDQKNFDTYKTENDKKVEDLEGKVDNLHNYDDTAIKKDIENIQNEQKTQNNNISSINNNISNINSSISEISDEQKEQDNAILNNINKITLLESKSGSKLNLMLNTENYVMTFELLNAKDEIISTQSIDFPLEQVIVNGRYENGSLILTLQNNAEITIPISSLINGLVNEETFNSFVEELETELETINSKLENVDTEIEELKTENEELANNMIWDTVQGTSFFIADAHSYSKNILKILDDLTEQEIHIKNINNISNFETETTGKIEGTNWCNLNFKIVNGYTSIISGKPTIDEYRVGNRYNSTNAVTKLDNTKSYKIRNSLNLNMSLTVVNSAEQTYRQINNLTNGATINLQAGEDGISSLRLHIDTNTTYNNTILEYYIYDKEENYTLTEKQTVIKLNEGINNIITVDALKPNLELTYMKSNKILKEQDEKEMEGLAQQFLWSTTDIQESIEVSDSAKYSKNKLRVFGNLKQKTRKGYNLIDTSQLPNKEQSGINITVNNGYPIVNGAATASFAYYNNVEEFVLEPGDYTLVLPTCDSVGTSTDIGVTVSLGYNNAVVTGFSLNNKTGFKNVTITEETHVNQLRMWFENNAAFTNYELKLMLLKGTYTEETMPEFEIYGVMPSIEYPSIPNVAKGIQKINIERNMLPLNPDDWENGTIDGSSGNLQDSSTRIRMKNYGEIKGNTEYFFSQIDNTNVVAIRFYDSNYNYLTGYNNTFISSIVTPNTAKFFKCAIKNPSSTTIDNTYIAEQKIKMYEKNKIELDLETTELCKITDEDGNVVAQDKVVYREVDGVCKWQFEKKIRKVIIDSNSTLTYNGLKDNNTLADFLTEALPNLPLNIYSPEIEKITKYNYLKPNSTSSTGRFRIAVELEKLGLEEVTTPAVAEQALKNLIEEKGDAIIYYVATETTYIDCTAEQSAVLDKLYKLQLEKGTNNIFAESEGGIAVELQLEYMQDLQSKLNNLNSLEERISNLEESILNL